MKKKITAIVAAAYIASLMTFGAYAQAPADNIAEGAGDTVENIGEGAGEVLDGIGDGISDVADGIGDAAGDVLDGAGNAVEDITGGDPGDEIVPEDIDEPDLEEEELTEISDDEDVEDTEETEDEPEDEDEDGAIYEAEINTGNRNDRNPATGGLPFMTAGLVSVAAAGVAYLTKKRNLENGTTR
ncbi:MAG: hypothetical protein II820_01940 [Ruminiclostridium sp.]|nr:hypothetical protein [Ruminiclostridium sp.]